MASNSMNRDCKAAVVDSTLECHQCTVIDMCAHASTRTASLLAFVDTDDVSEQKVLQHSLDLPSTFWSPTLQESSGFFKAREVAGDISNKSSYDTWFRFLVKMPQRGASLGQDSKTTIVYKWYKLCFFTRWQPNTKPLIIAFDIPISLRQDFEELDLERIPLGSPFAAHALLLEKICPIFDRAVWACRDLIRAHEKQRPSADRPQPDYEDLHEIGRHAIHSTEMLATASNVVEAMIEEHRNFPSGEEPSLEHREARRSLQYHKTLLQGFQLRSQALESRLSNELNLSFHVNAQYDSIVQGRIAQSAQADSAAMRTISFLGLVFLPGTFISAVFSMSFFDFSPPNNATQQFRVSSSFWMFWAVSIPVTLLTILLWTLWHRSVQARGVKSLLFAPSERQDKTTRQDVVTSDWLYRLRDRRAKGGSLDLER